MLQGLYKFHQYQVVGRHLPTANDENPQIYRMKLWATDAVRAKSKFWCVLHHLSGAAWHLQLALSRQRTLVLPQA